MSTCSCASKGRPEWFPFHAADFLNSDTCADVNGVERALYALMLVLAWNGPGLPADRRRLANRLGVDREQVDDLLDGPVGENWFECCGKLWNERMEEQRVKAEARSKAGAKGGKASAEKRRQKASRKASDPTTVQRPFRTTVERPLNDRLERPLNDRSTTVERPFEQIRGEEIREETLPSGSVGAHAPAEGQSKLGKALGEALEPIPPEAEDALRLWAEHLTERVGASRGVAYWRGELKSAGRDPAVYAQRVAFSISKDAKSVLAPKSDELAAFLGEQDSTALAAPGTGGVEAKHLPFNAKSDIWEAKQREDRRRRLAAIDAAEAAAAEPRLVNVEPPRPRLAGGDR